MGACENFRKLLVLSRKKMQEKMQIVIRHFLYQNGFLPNILEVQLKINGFNTFTNFNCNLFF